MSDPIARLPVDDGIDDEWCTVCSDDNIVVVINNKVALCSKCLGTMQVNIEDLGI